MAIYVTVECCGEKHRIGLEGGKRVIVDPEAHDIELELGLVEMGAERPKCIELYQQYPDAATLARHALYKHKRGYYWLDIYHMGKQIAEALEGKSAIKELYAGVDYSDYVDEEIAALLERAKAGETVDMGYWGDRDQKVIVEGIIEQLQQAFEDDAGDRALELTALLSELFHGEDPWDLTEHDDEYDNGLDGGVTLVSDRALTFFGEPVVEWKRMFEKRYFNEVNFSSYDEVDDLCEASWDYCTPEAVDMVLFYLQLEEDEKPEVSEPWLEARPCAPPDEDTCDYGVLYEPDPSNPYLSGPNDWRQTTVMPYETLADVYNAIKQTEILSSARGEGDLYIMTPVRRVPDKKFAAAVRRVEEDRKNWRLFGIDIVPELTNLDYLKLQWQPWDEHLEEMLQDGMLPEEEL